MTRLILFLIRRKLGVKKFDGFRFSNQRSDVDYYYFTKTGLYKVDYGTGEIIPSRVSLNWLMSDKCTIRKLKDAGENE